MSNHTNHRRSEKRRTEHGPAWENSNPGKGCNSTHVARARKWWRKFMNRTLRRNGRVSKKMHMQLYKPGVFYEDELKS